MRRSSFAVLPLSLLLVVVSVTACSSDSKSSQQAAVCSDASALKDSVNQLGTDVKSGNFGNAKDQVSKVQSDFTAARELGQEVGWVGEGVGPGRPSGRQGHTQRSHVGDQPCRYPVHARQSGVPAQGRGGLHQKDDQLLVDAPEQPTA